MATLSLLFDDNEDRGFLEFMWSQEGLYEAQRQWKMELCVEWNQGHAWELIIEEADDGTGNAFLACAHCPAEVDDLFPDGQEWLHFENEDVRVDGGQHSSSVALIIPVSAKVWIHHYCTADADEWDAGIDLEQIGPTRRVVHEV